MAFCSGLRLSAVKIEKPKFNADSAYRFVKEQVDFGPRFPNNEAHAKCAIYLENKLTQK